MNIVLIGFTGTGKSYWASKLAKDLGFKRFCVDDMIVERLGPLLPKGKTGLEAVSDWMGEPHHTRYAQNVQVYLQAEAQIMRDFLNGGLSTPPRDTVLDTTGSVIYLEESITAQLAAFGCVVYLEVIQEVLEDLFHVFLAEPKPVVWGDAFTFREGESVREAYRRSYPELLRFRKGQYEKLAEISLDYHLLRSKDFGVANFIQEIEKVRKHSEV